jgi:hypothetical protein
MKLSTRSWVCYISKHTQLGVLHFKAHAVGCVTFQSTRSWVCYISKHTQFGVLHFKAHAVGCVTFQSTRSWVCYISKHTQFGVLHFKAHAVGCVTQKGKHMKITLRILSFVLLTLVANSYSHAQGYGGGSGYGGGGTGGGTTSEGGNAGATAKVGLSLDNNFDFSVTVDLPTTRWGGVIYNMWSINADYSDTVTVNAGSLNTGGPSKGISSGTKRFWYYVDANSSETVQQTPMTFTETVNVFGNATQFTNGSTHSKAESTASIKYGFSQSSNTPLKTEGSAESSWGPQGGIPGIYGDNDSKLKSASHLFSPNTVLASNGLFTRMVLTGEGLATTKTAGSANP